MWDFTSERSKTKFQVSWDYGAETWPRHAKHIFFWPLPYRPKGVSVCSVVKEHTETDFAEHRRGANCCDQLTDRPTPT